MSGEADDISGENRLRRRTTAIAVALALAVGCGAVAKTAFGGGEPASEAGAARAAVVRAVALDGDDRLTRITVDLDHAAPLRIFTVAEPPRLVVDLPAAKLATAAPASGRGLVAATRWDAGTGTKARLVFDLAGTAKVADASFGGTDGDRLVVDLARASPAEMRDGRPIRLAAASDAPATTATIAPAAAKSDRDRVAAQTVPAAPAPATARRPVIVIDPGHGGVDVGTRSPATGTFEKTVVLDMARVVMRALEATGHYDVRATRTEDVYVPLPQRVAIAREDKADLLISIHADAEYDHSVRGATVYTLAEKASDAKAAALAAKENAADALTGHVAADEGGEVGDILADLTLRETRRFSLIAARDILAEYRRWGRLVKGEAHREAGLRVLRAHDVPSVLIEIGFLSNKDDEALMTSPAWREKIAEGLVQAVDRFFAQRGVPGMARAPETHTTAGAAASP